MDCKDLGQSSNPKFSLGALIFSATVDRLVRKGKLDPMPLLHRHLCGDWGEMCDQDKALNDDALKSHYRLFSAYEVPPHYRVWIITEADRSATTVLLPEDY
ncbi:hypothetical protein [Pseudomonas fluorescens]|uniref:hypothetical protein n=1 Tax=Pseudomonas fluorescens TaxID=294 RepID=UPI001BE6B291|nr:hypothetical protein [Pseudomonas fluorescens]MBT2375316.1 hypothetical protein [Pseudomonas fluorescens]